MVTGVAALASGANPSLTAAQLRQCIITGAAAGGRQVQGQPFYVVNAKKTVECAIAQRLAVTTTSLPNAVLAQPYSATLAATGGTAPLTWSVSAGALPAGLSLSAAGSISGTASIAGSNSFTATVIDSTGTTTDRALTLAVIGGQTQGGTISAGSYHSCAVTTAGAVKCWGVNKVGELGDGTTTSSSTPVDVVGLGSGVAAVDAGWEHTCALTTAGAVKCWGYNSNGELGYGTTTYYSNTPVDVVGLGSGVAAITAGMRHTCALITGGAIKCWGSNL
ncbi:MAG: RCC1 repeat-containing protein, partial [Phycicoccus sp.]|nr:RCC1 repeat-containing protein [Phycicoccus sp.]